MLITVIFAAPNSIGVRPMNDQQLLAAIVAGRSWKSIKREYGIDERTIKARIGKFKMCDKCGLRMAVDKYKGVRVCEDCLNEPYEPQRATDYVQAYESSIARCQLYADAVTNGNDWHVREKHK
jgi:hypothetical protein